MAKELNANEEKNLSNLSDNMQQQLLEYEKISQKKSKVELSQELIDLDDYLNGCYNSEIDDTEINIRFCEGKSVVLKKILENL